MAVEVQAQEARYGLGRCPPILGRGRCLKLVHYDHVHVALTLDRLTMLVKDRNLHISWRGTQLYIQLIAFFDEKRSFNIAIHALLDPLGRTGSKSLVDVETVESTIFSN